MMELEINGQVFQFNFGIGFVREIDKKCSVEAEGAPGGRQNTGLQYVVGSLIDGEVDVLIDTLFTANKGQNPRVTKAALDSYVDDPDTDIEGLFDQVMDFLKSSNASKKKVNAMLKKLEELEEAEKAKNQ